MTIYDKYCDDVLSGRIPTGIYVKKACERYKAFRLKYDFREDIVDRVVTFIGHLKHYQGKHKGEYFKLEPWQYFVVANIFGFYTYETTDEDGNIISPKRVTQSVYIQMARKQGKTAFIAAIALYCLIADGEAGAEVDCIANSRQQAHLLFDMAKHFSGDIDPKKKHFQRLRDSLKYAKTASVIQVQASDSANLDGYNPSCYILDEVHEYPDSKLYDVMSSGQGMRENPLGILITTAGFSLTGFCYNHRKMCIDILYNLLEDDTQFSLIYELDEEDEWDNPDVWIKANPNLGVTVSKSFLLKEINRAKNNATLKKSVLTKNLDVWLPDGVDTWISDKVIVSNSHDIEWDFFKDRIVFIGIDLSAVSDLTSTTYFTKDVPTGMYYFKTRFYLPESTLHDNPNCELYLQWYRQGVLQITPGNVTDYDYILKDIQELIGTGMILDSIHYDQYNATQFAINATAAGLKMKPFAQALYNFNRPTREFERLIKQGKVVLDNNLITRWCFTNAVLKFDHNDNCKVVKRGGAQSMMKIDGVITITEALGGYMYSDTAKYESTDMSV